MFKPSPSDIFSIAPDKYVRALGKRWLKKFAWLLLIPVVACAILAFSDLRFLFLLFILVFIVEPMTRPIIWLFVTNKSSFSLLIHPQRCFFSKENYEELTLEFYRFGVDPEEPGEPFHRIVIPRSALANVQKRGTYVEVDFNANFIRATGVLFIILPVNVVPD